MPRDVRNLVLGAIACALALPVVAFFAYEVGAVAHLDNSLFRQIVETEGSRRYDLADGITNLGNPLPFLAILAGLTVIGLAARRRRETAAALAVVAGANVSTQILKHLFEHRRWDETLGIHQPLMESFPSGHTTAAASLAVALVLVVPARLRTVAVAVGAAFAAAVGLGVVVIGVHYPSDVIGGLLVVGAWTFAALAGLRLWRLRDPDAPAHREQDPGSGGFAVSLR